MIITVLFEGCALKLESWLIVKRSVTAAVPEIRFRLAREIANIQTQ